MTRPRLPVPDTAPHVMARGGTTTARARPFGLIFYPLQARATLTRTLRHPTGQTERMTTGDAATPRHLMPMYRRTTLDRPRPAGPVFEWDDTSRTLPRLDQELPLKPTPEEIAGNGYLTGFDGVTKPDNPWSTEEKKAYLSRHSPPSSTDADVGWHCRKCLNPIKARHHERPIVYVPSEVATHDASRHEVGPTISVDPADARWFKGGGHILEWIAGFGEDSLIRGIDIGGDNLMDDDENDDGIIDEEENPDQNIAEEHRRHDRRGRPTSAYRMGDTMPAWARVVQMIEVLRNHTASGGAPLKFIALCCHGWTDGLQLGLTMNPASDAYRYSKLFLRTLAQMCDENLSVIVYGCSTAGPSDTFGYYSLGNWIRHQLKRFGVDSPRVDGHTLAADAFKTPWVRRFENGHDAGRWIVQPAFKTRDGQVRARYPYELQLRNDRGSTGMTAAQQLPLIRDLAREAKKKAIQHGRANGPEPRFSAADVASVVDLWDAAQRHFNRVRPIPTTERTVELLQECYERYEYLIHFLPLAEDGSSVNETEGEAGTYVADLPPPPEPPPADPLDFDRWVKWERCVRHAIDFMTFEYPLLSTAQIHEYLDRLPTMPEAGASGATFEQRLRRVANPDDPATLHTWLFETGGSAPLGSYFGTVPGAMRSR